MIYTALHIGYRMMPFVETESRPEIEWRDSYDARLACRFVELLAFLLKVERHVGAFLRIGLLR